MADDNKTIEVTDASGNIMHFKKYDVSGDGRCLFTSLYFLEKYNEAENKKEFLENDTRYIKLDNILSADINVWIEANYINPIKAIDSKLSGKDNPLNTKIPEHLNKLTNDELKEKYTSWVKSFWIDNQQFIEQYIDESKYLPIKMEFENNTFKGNIFEHGTFNTNAQKVLAKYLLILQIIQLNNNSLHQQLRQRKMTNKKNMVDIIGMHLIMVLVICCQIIFIW